MHFPIMFPGTFPKALQLWPRKEGDPKNFRKIDDDDDPIVRKMKQSEEMRRVRGAGCSSVAARDYKRDYEGV